jgi:hypothetical protein
MLYALSQVIGNGTAVVIAGQEPTTGPYRPRAHIYGQFVAVIPANPDGTPAHNWCLVKLVGADESGGSPLRSDGGLIVMPPPGALWTTQQINLANLRLGQEGFPSNLLTVGMRTEDCVNAVGNYISPGWTLAQPFSVGGQ